QRLGGRLPDPPVLVLQRGGEIRTGRRVAEVRERAGSPRTRPVIESWSERIVSPPSEDGPGMAVAYQAQHVGVRVGYGDGGRDSRQEFRQVHLGACVAVPSPEISNAASR